MTAFLASHDDIQALLGAYALDAAEPEEAEVVTRHLEVCPRCRAELREHREVAGLLGYAGQEAPPGLWDRIAASTQEPPPALRLHSFPAPVVGARSATRRRRTMRVRTVAVGAAAAAVVVAVLAVQVARLDHRTAAIGNEVAASLAPGPPMHAVDAALAVPGARKVVLAPVSTSESVDAVILPGGQGYLYRSQLSPLPGAETYQLWGISGNQAVSYGLLGSNPAPVVSFTAGAGVEALAITAESAGGVAHSVHAAVASGGVVPAL